MTGAGPTVERSGLSSAELARLRRAAYRLFSTLLLPPDGERLAVLPGLARALRGESAALAAYAFWASWSRLLDTLAALGNGGSAWLGQAYAKSFVGTATSTPCPPWESAYAPRDAMAWIIADLEREYAQAGLSVVTAAAVTADHAAVELEYLSLLAREECRAWECEDLDAVARLAERAIGFLDVHLVRWFPEFTRRAGREDPDGFYAVVADAAWAFIAHDRDLLWGLTERLTEAGCR